MGSFVSTSWQGKVQSGPRPCISHCFIAVVPHCGVHSIPRICDMIVNCACGAPPFKWTAWAQRMSSRQLAASKMTANDILSFAEINRGT